MTSMSSSQPTARHRKAPARVRVLMYTAYLSPEYSGAAQQALTLAKSLRSRGHHVEFATNRWGDLPATADIEGFAVRRLQPGRAQKHRELRLWLNLGRYVWRRRSEFDVLHSHGAYFTNAFVGPLARLCGLKSVIKASLAEDDLKDLDQPFVGWLHRAMLRSVDACVGISAALVKEFHTGGVAREKTHHIANGVDTGHFAPPRADEKQACRAALSLPPERRLALFIGVLDQRKKILWLAREWVAHDAFGTGAMLVAVGPRARDDRDGAIHGELSQLARDHPRHLVLRDFQANIGRYYQAADLLILPSEKEGLPNAVLEAMASGLPCLVARTSGSVELVAEGETGYTFAPGNVDELRDALHRILGDSAEALGARARRVAEHSYAIDEIADRYLRLYEGLLRPAKRVLYVENGIGYGGAIICLRHLVRNLDRNRYAPMVITGLGDERYQEIAAEAPWKHIPDRRLDVSALRRALAAWRGASALPGLRWLLSQGLARLDDAANFLPSLVQTLWVMARFRPAIVHVNNEPLCNRAAVLAGKMLRVPVVSHVRGDQKGSALMHPLYRLPDYFITVSRWVSESIGQIGVPEDRRTYIYDGIELGKLDLHADGSGFRHTNGLPLGAFIVGLVGLLIPWKGQQMFLEAAQLLSAKLPDAVFAVVGGTPEEFEYFESELRGFVRDAGLDERVVFTGHVRDMAAAYNGLDVVLSASTSPEPLGTMIIESMTMARPVLAPDHGGAVEMIEDGRTGLLFKAGDAADLASKIERLYQQRQLGVELGTAARAHALQTFAVDRHARQVEAVYDRILGRS